MMSAELDGIICSGARKGKQFTYALIEEVAPPVKAKTRDESLAELVTRYFSTRGPATLHDFAWWSGLTIADAKQGMDMVKSKFIQEEFNNQNYWFADVSVKKVKAPAVYLLPNYDEYFIGFKDRSAIGDVAKKENIKGDDPAFLAHVIICDGQIIGGWRRELKKDEVQIEITLIKKQLKAEKEAIHQAAKKFGAFLNLPIKIIYKEK